MQTLKNAQASKHKFKRKTSLNDAEKILESSTPTHTRTKSGTKQKYTLQTPLTNNNSNTENAHIDKTASPSGKKGKAVSPEDSFLIFDWDDTLLASHHVSNLGYSLESNDIFPPDVKQQLKRLEKVIICVLEGAIELVGVENVVIITNADYLWVELSAKKYVPAVLKILNKGILIISARQRYEHLFESNPYHWKLHTFQDYLETVLDMSIDLPEKNPQSPKKMKLSETATGSHSTGCARFASQLKVSTDADNTDVDGIFDEENVDPNTGSGEDLPPPARPADDDQCQDAESHAEFRTPQNRKRPTNGSAIRERDSWYNVISIGDSMAEREAVIQCCRAIDKCWTKSIKFQERPTIEQVITQLSYVSDQLSHLCESPLNIDWFLDPAQSTDETNVES